MTTCGRCGEHMIPVHADHKTLTGWACLSCGIEVPISAPAPTPQTGPKPPRQDREGPVQSRIVRALRESGVQVLQTSRHRRRCQRCGSYQTAGDGCDKGLPDLFAWSELRQAWVGLEVKGPTTRVSPEQRALADAGRIHVVRTSEEACCIMEREEVG